MSTIMSRAELAATLAASMHDMASVFTGGFDDFSRHLDAAAMDMGRARPRTLLGTITLVADQEAYAAPADLLVFKSSVWPVRRSQPWEKNWTGKLPDVSVESTGEAATLHLAPPPTAQQITQYGASYRFYYLAGHVIADNGAQTTVRSADRGLLILRAQAEAMRELMMRNAGKPVTMRDGISGGTRNGTPSAIFESLMKEFESKINHGGAT